MTLKEIKKELVGKFIDVKENTTLTRHKIIEVEEYPYNKVTPYELYILRCENIPNSKSKDYYIRKNDIDIFLANKYIVYKSIRNTTRYWLDNNIEDLYCETNGNTNDTQLSQEPIESKEESILSEKIQNNNIWQQRWWDVFFELMFHGENCRFEYIEKYAQRGVEITNKVIKGCMQKIDEFFKNK